MVLGSSSSTCFPSIILFCLGFRFHFSFEGSCLLGMRSQQSIFVIVFILTMEDGGLGSGPCRHSNPSLSLFRKLPLLFILTCPIEAKVLRKIQEGPFRGKEICIPEDKMVLRELWA